MKDTFIINKDITFIIYSFLNFHDRVSLSLCSKSHYSILCNYKHPEIIKISDRNLYKLCRRMTKWKNTKFNINLLDCLDFTPNCILNSELRALNLLECDKIKDISMLKKAFILDLSYFRSIRDVSMLGNLHMLILHGCYNITDVSALGNINHLNLSGCWKIKDVSMLYNIPTLILCGCFKITDISKFKEGRMKILDISGCYGIKNIPNLSNLEVFIRRY